MLRLNTFGGLSVERDGVVLEQLTAQRKALAVLAVLAAAQPSGLSRDKLLALFWPESDADRARGALKQLLHVLRRELGHDAVRGTAELRLDTTLLATDVNEFRLALAAGDDQSAVRIYRGAFLDGVHLDDAFEFERWVETEAAVLARAYQAALETLARDTQDRSDWRAATDFWRRLYAIDSLNTRFAIGLVTALHASGDRAGAFRVAREHDLRLSHELDLPPDPALTELVERLRTGASSAAPRVTSAPVSAPSAAHAGPGEGDSNVETQRTVNPRPALPTRGARLWYAAAAAVTTLLLLAVVLITRGPFRADASLDPNRVAVTIFENRSGDPALDRLGIVAADWVTRGITRLPLRVLDEAALYSQGRTATDIRTLARQHAAGLIVAGSYYAAHDSVLISARIVRTSSGEVLHSLDPIRGLLRDPVPAVDEMRQRVTAALASVIDAGAITHDWTQPPRYAAYLAYVAGQDVYWRGRFAEAIPYMASAVALDSAFHSAEVHLAVASVGIGRCGVADSIRRKLESVFDRLAPAERIRLQINSARCDTNWEEALRLQRELAALTPGSNAAAWPSAAGARRSNRPAEALLILKQMSPAQNRWSLNRDPVFYWREVTAAQHALDDHSAEIQAAQEAKRRIGNRLGLTYMNARALIGAGRSADALRALENVELLDSDPVLVVAEISWQMDAHNLATAGWVLHQLATEMLAHHSDSAANTLLERADQWFRRRPASEAARLEQRLTHARVLELLAHYDEAERLLQLVRAQDSLNIDARGMHGVLAARRGQRDLALRIDRELAALTNWSPPGAPGLYRAQIAALLGDHSRALDLLEALPHRVHPAEPLFFHSDPAFLPLHGNPRFEAFIRPRG